MIVGGGVAASAKCAFARCRLRADPHDLFDVYLDECRSLGQPPGQYFRPGPVPISIHL